MSSNAAFFEEKDPKRGMEDFFSEVKAEKEPQGTGTDEDDFVPPDAQFLGDEEPGGQSETDEEIQDAEIVEAEEGHLLSAQFFLKMWDNVMSFILAGYSKKSKPEKFQRWPDKPKKSDVEVELLAKLMKKWSMQTSLESMFAMAMFFAYMPLAYTAYQDRQDANKEKEKKKKQKAKYQEATILEENPTEI